MGYSPRGHKELDTTERLHFSLSLWLGQALVAARGIFTAVCGYHSLRHTGLAALPHMGSPYHPPSGIEQASSALKVDS